MSARRTEQADADLAGGGAPDDRRDDDRRDAEPRTDDRREEPRRDDRPPAADDQGDPGRYSRAHGEQTSGPGGASEDAVRVLDPGRADEMRGRWTDVQAGFVDEPRQSVTHADQLVGEVLDEVSRVFRTQREELERDWNSQQEPDTEELRQALRRYREFFDRLLSL